MTSVFTNARIVLATGVLDPGTLVIEHDRIVDVRESSGLARHGTRDMSGTVIVPGFVDVHVHGVEGRDTLDEDVPLATIAALLARYGVTAFCPTTVACSPAALVTVLRDVQRGAKRDNGERAAEPRGGEPGGWASPGAGARVIGAHLESNFINPEYRGAQPLACLREPPPTAASGGAIDPGAALPGGDDDYTGVDILRAIDAVPGATAIVTMAPELPAGIELVRALVSRGIRVSLGHSGATYEESLAGFDAGAAHATHLFNRMSPLHHRDPGLVGAVFERDDVDAELVCDGYHVHPTAARLALRVKTPDRIMAITDGTGGSGLPVGATARLGGRTITVRETAAFLDDGTLAGSTLTMDRAFRSVIGRFGCSLSEATRLCSATPARALGLADQGQLLPGRLADFTVLDPSLHVLETWVGGRRVFPALQDQP